MHKLAPITFLILFACSKKENKLRRELTDEEVYAVINNLYTDYLDSLERPHEIYYRHAILEDSAVLTLQVEDLQGTPTSNYLRYSLNSYEEWTPGGMPLFDKKIWKASKLPSFTIIQKDQFDCEVQERIAKQDWYNNEYVHYAITRPYRPSFSMRIVMQE